MTADCHMHMLLDGKDWRAAIARHENGPDIPYIHSVLARYRDLGVTYLRDGGDRWGVGKAARELANAYGITYRTPLAPLCKAGHYGGFIGRTYETEKEYAALISEMRDGGCDFIKIMVSGLMDFHTFGVLTEPPLTNTEIKSLVSIAHEEGFSVMAHCNGAEAMLAAAEAGVDSIEHGAYANEEALSAMAEKKVVWVPTLSTIGNLLGKGRFPDEAVSKILESAQENVAFFLGVGGILALGTDAGAWAVPHGSREEKAYLAAAGATDADLRKGIEEIKRRF